MTRFGIATIFEDHPIGHEFSPDNLPLHLTHVDSCTIDGDISDLVSKLQDALKDTRQFSVTAIKDAYYGPDKDILVTELQLNTPLHDLHTRIMTILDHAGAALKNPHFHNAGFEPHITIYGKKRVTVGSKVLIKDLSIVSKVSDDEYANRRVIANITLNS